MAISENELRHALEPLRVVDIKTLSAIADSLKGSSNKGKKAVGVFLDRINRYRLEEPSQRTSAPAPGAAGARTPNPTPVAGQKDATKPVIDLSTGLQDLQE